MKKQSFITLIDFFYFSDELKLILSNIFLRKRFYSHINPIKRIYNLFIWTFLNTCFLIMHNFSYFFLYLHK